MERFQDTMIGRIVYDARRRRIAYAVIAVILLILCAFPRPFVARAKVVPQDTSASAASTTALLGALGTGAQSIGSLLTGGRPSNDLYLILGRSDSVADRVIQRLDLVGPGKRFATSDEAKKYLRRHNDIHLLLGGVIEIETRTFDRQQSVEQTRAYVSALSDELAAFGRQIIVNKQRIVQRRFRGALERVAQAGARLSAFRRANNLAVPDVQLGAAVSRRTALEAQLQAKELELRTTSEFAGPESVTIKQLQSEVAGLQNEILRSNEAARGVGGPNLTALTALDQQYLNLYRDYRFAQGMYDVYARSAEQVEVEQLAAESASYVQIIDDAHADSERHFNTSAVALLIALALLAIFTEWYAPLTGLFTLRRATEAHVTA